MPHACVSPALSLPPARPFSGAPVGTAVPAARALLWPPALCRLPLCPLFLFPPHFLVAAFAKLTLWSLVVIYMPPSALCVVFVNTTAANSPLLFAIFCSHSLVSLAFLFGAPSTAPPFVRAVCPVSRCSFASFRRVRSSCACAFVAVRSCVSPLSVVCGLWPFGFCGLLCRVLSGSLGSVRLSGAQTPRVYGVCVTDRTPPSAPPTAPMSAAHARNRPSNTRTHSHATQRPPRNPVLTRRKQHTRASCRAASSDGPQPLRVPLWRTHSTRAHNARSEHHTTRTRPQQHTSECEHKKQRRTRARGAPYVGWSLIRRYRLWPLPLSRMPLALLPFPVFVHSTVSSPCPRPPFGPPFSPLPLFRGAKGVGHPLGRGGPAGAVWCSDGAVEGGRVTRCGYASLSAPATARACGVLRARCAVVVFGRLLLQCMWCCAVCCFGVCSAVPLVLLPLWFAL